MCHLKRPLRYGGYLICNQIQQNKGQCFPMDWRRKLFRALCSRVVWYDYIKNIYSVATIPLQFRNGMYNFVTELIHLLCYVFANYTFWHNKYELSLTIDIGLLHMYHLSVLPPKQHNIPLIVSRQISIPNVSPNWLSSLVLPDWPSLPKIAKQTWSNWRHLRHWPRRPN